MADPQTKRQGSNSSDRWDEVGNSGSGNRLNLNADIKKKIIRRFRDLGFSGPISGGKHPFMVNGELKVRIPNPHKADDISDALLKEILRQAEINKAEWENE